MIKVPITFIMLDDEDKRLSHASIADILSSHPDQILSAGADGKLFGKSTRYSFEDNTNGRVTTQFVVTTNPNTGDKTVSVLADPELSSAAGNQLQLRTDGLFYHGMQITSLTQTANSLSLNYRDNNDAAQSVQSTVVQNCEASYDAASGKLKILVNGVQSNEVTITGTIADINVDTFTWNQGQHILKLTETDGTIHTIDLSSLVASSVSGSIQGDGTSANPLKLAGDQTAPGPNMVYGTNAAGEKGYFSAQPANATGRPVTTVASVPELFLGNHGRKMDVADPDFLIPVQLPAGTSVKTFTYAANGVVTVATQELVASTTFQIPAYSLS